MFTSTAKSEWIERVFSKRECSYIIASAKYNNRCCCGLLIINHQYAKQPPAEEEERAAGEDENAFAAAGQQAAAARKEALPRLSLTSSLMSSPTKSVAGGGGAVPNAEHWSPLKHTQAMPTDAFGCIDFRGTHTNKAQYLRLSYDTKPDIALNFLLRGWGLSKPKLLITVTGGKANFDLQPRIKWSLRKGLLKAAKTTGAWLLTGGTNTGVNKHVGDALISEKSPRIKGGRVASIGIAPWGVVERRNELVGIQRDVPFHTTSQPRSRFAALNKDHAFFLLVDNGTVGKYGAEIALRRKLEKYVSTQSLDAGGGDSDREFSTPLVCLVIEGGTNTIRAVLEYVTATPPVPVVVCDGTGRAADLLAFAHKYAEEDGDLGVAEDIRDMFQSKLKKTFKVSSDQAARLYIELRQCMKRKHLITIFRCSNDRGARSSGELDEVILTALFKAQHLHPSEQLSLALTWNRSDIAKKEIFKYGQEWPEGELDRAMQEALELDRVDFVRLLLDQDVDMHKFLTMERLEELYNTKRGPPNTLNYLVRDVVPRMSRGYVCTLFDIGLVINQLMGAGYTSPYSIRKAKPITSAAAAAASNTLQKTGTAISLKLNGVSSADSPFKTESQQNGGAADSVSVGGWSSGDGGGEGNASGGGGGNYNKPDFAYPFSELIVWAVLTKRQEMAKLMWLHGEQNMAKALVASRLYQAMAMEAADDDLDIEVYDELTSYSKVFEDMAVELLEYCYQHEDELTEHLLTASLENWSRQTCLKLAVMAKNLRFLAHPLSQSILADLWMGGLRMRKNPGFKILLCLLFPPAIIKLDFKTQEELKLMPQTEEEWDHDDRRDSKTSSSSSSSSSSTSSRRSSIAGGGGVDRDMDSLSSLEMGAAATNSRMTKRYLMHQLTKTGPATAATVETPHGQQLNDEHQPMMAKVTSGGGGGFSGAGADGQFSDKNPFSSAIFDELFVQPDTLLRRKNRPLKWKKKIYEFYAAPITKYYCHTVAYVIFLSVYTYTCLVKKSVEPSASEWYVFACILNFLLEKVRQMMATEPNSAWKKLQVFLTDTKWNVGDSIAILLYLVPFLVRCLSGDPAASLPAVHVIHSTDITYWYVRSLKFIGANKYFGPFVMMIGKMIEHMIYFVVLLLVVLMAFGVCRQAILFPDQTADWQLVRHIFYQPYFMLYGEVFAGDISPDCDPDCTEYGACGKAADGSLLVPCHPGRWVTPIVMTVYLLVANLLLLNLMIATFNTIYNSVNAVAQQFWHFQRFSVVLEYEEKPILPAPLTFLSHLHRLLRYTYRACKGRLLRYQTGLKVILNKHDLERLYDFEEECAEGLMQKRENEKAKTVSATVRTLHESVEDIRSKVEDMLRYETATQEVTNSLDFRLQRLEDLGERTADQMAVIHRFMATQGSAEQSDDDDDDDEVADDDDDDTIPEDDEDEGSRASSDVPAPVPKINEEIIDVMVDKAAVVTGGGAADGGKTVVSVKATEDTLECVVSTLEEKPEEEDAEEEKEKGVKPLKKEETAAEPPPPPPPQPTEELDRVRFQLDDMEQSPPPPPPPAESSHNLQVPSLHHRNLAEASPKSDSWARISDTNAPGGGGGGQSEQARRMRLNKTRHFSSGGGGSFKRHRRATESSCGTSEDYSQHIKRERQSLKRTKRQRHVSVGNDYEPTPENELVVAAAGMSGSAAAAAARLAYKRSHSEMPTKAKVDEDANAPANADVTDTDDVSSDRKLNYVTSSSRSAAARSKMQAAARSKCRDYTSITDELEQMIVVSRAQSESVSPKRSELPAIKIEAECLHDAEETDYNLMETLIERRLRRDSHNLQASLEDLVAKSIKDESSSSSSSSSGSGSSSSSSKSGSGSDSDTASPPPSSSNLLDSSQQQKCDKIGKNKSKRKKPRKRRPSKTAKVVAKSQLRQIHHQLKAESKLSLASLEEVEPPGYCKPETGAAPVEAPGEIEKPTTKVKSFDI